MNHINTNTDNSNATDQVLRAVPTGLSRPLSITYYSDNIIIVVLIIHIYIYMCTYVCIYIYIYTYTHYNSI